MSSSINWETQGIHVVLEGDITVEDITMPKAEFHQDPRFENLRYSIWDFSGVTHADVSIEDVMTLVALDLGAAYTLPMHKLVVVTGDERIAELSAAFVDRSKASESPWKFHVANTLEEARDWIAN